MSEPTGERDDGGEATAGDAVDDPFGLVGVTIHDKYRVTSTIGSGGFGVVYRAVHRGFDEPVAVKCLKLPSDLGKPEREELLSRLQEEGRVLHRLSKLSSGIVQALDVGAVTTPAGLWAPYLVLEWLDGETLKEHLASRKRSGAGPYSLDGAMALLEPAARALAVAHRQKVAHRDVKPENLYLTQVSGERTLKVLDFGIAKVLAQHAVFTAAPTATQAQPTAFTPCYGAPEQFNKKRGATGPWTDVFALALILVELVTGERALHGDDATQLYIAAADPASRPTLRYHGVETSDSVEDVLGRALAIDPSDRYQDAGAFWKALRKAAGDEPAADTVPTDVSETGEFVTRHEIGLDPRELSDRPPKAQRPPDEPSAASDDTTPSALADEVPATRREAAVARVGSPARGRRSPPPSERPSAARPASETTQIPAASSRWVPVVVVLALLGAVVLYFQLREIERPNWLGGPPVTPTRPRTPPASGASSRPRPATSGSASVQLDGGELDGGELDGGELDGGPDGGDAGDGGAALAVPEGMVLVGDQADAGPLGGFFLDVLEVSVADYDSCVKAGRCVAADRIAVTVEAAKAFGGTPESLEEWRPRCNAVRKRDDHPINCINHGSARDYCRFVGKRLPTAAEWSRAAGAAEGRRFPWGDSQPECETACFDLQRNCTHHYEEVATCRVGSHPADTTPEGVKDMGGGVAEWVADEAPGAQPGTGEPPWRFALGGSFHDGVAAMAVGSKRPLPQVTAFVSVGFRCAQDVPRDPR